jgi:hypothetical protein
MAEYPAGDGLPAQEGPFDAGALAPIAAQAESELGIPKRACREWIVDQSFPTIAGNAPAAAPPHAVQGNRSVVVIDDPVPLVLVRITGGRFRMGDTQGIG